MNLKFAKYEVSIIPVGIRSHCGDDQSYARSKLVIMCDFNLKIGLQNRTGRNETLTGTVKPS